MDAYGLTPAEARVALAISSGLSIPETSQGVSPVAQHDQDATERRLQQERPQPADRAGTHDCVYQAAQCGRSRQAANASERLVVDFRIAFSGSRFDSLCMLSSDIAQVNCGWRSAGSQFHAGARWRAARRRLAAVSAITARQHSAYKDAGCSQQKISQVDDRVEPSGKVASCPKCPGRIKRWLTRRCGSRATL